MNLIEKLENLTEFTRTTLSDGSKVELVSKKEVLEIVKEYEGVEECLREAIDLMEDVITGDYKPDSFTTQPWKSALSQHPNNK